MKTKRLFVAVPISQHYRDKLNRTAQQIGEFSRLNWVPVTNLHITLYFIGSVKEDLTTQIIQKLDSASENTNHFQLEFSQLAFAPPNHQPNMIWAIFKSNQEYVYLVNQVSKQLSPISQTKNQHHKLIPHITLARFKSPKVMTKINLRPIELISLTINKFGLYESKTLPDQPVYQEIHCFHLQT